jgi:hypothetical protein
MSHVYLRYNGIKKELYPDGTIGDKSYDNVIALSQEWSTTPTIFIEQLEVWYEDINLGSYYDIEVRYGCDPHHYMSLKELYEHVIEIVTVRNKYFKLIDSVDIWKLQKPDKLLLASKLMKLATKLLE